MFWTPLAKYKFSEFKLEKDLESVVENIKLDLFGSSRIYLSIKKLIGEKSKFRNIPDGYLIDFSLKKPRLIIVEVELKSHDRKHILSQLAEFASSFEEDGRGVKKAILDALHQTEEWVKLENYASGHGYRNVDDLIEQLVFGNTVSTLLIIDEFTPQIRSVLKRLNFPVEYLEISRYRDEEAHEGYRFTPYLYEVAKDLELPIQAKGVPPIGLEDIDTIVVPARKDGFERVFLGEDQWYEIRINTAMISQIRYIAGYEKSPVSAIRYVAEIDSIERYMEGEKYVVKFKSKAQKLHNSIPLVKRGKVYAPRGPRYTNYERLLSAKTLDELWGQNKTE